MDFQESVIEAVSFGFPFEFIMNLPYSSYLSMLESMQKVKAKKGLELLLLTAAPHSTSKLLKDLHEGYTEELLSYLSFEADSVEDRVAEFNNFLQS